MEESNVYGNNAFITTVVNHKGGVGKTTLSLNLSYSLSNKGYKTLIIDNDNQGSLSTCFGVYGNGTMDLYNGKSFQPDKINKNLHVLPANLELRKTPVSITNKVIGKELVLKKMINKFNLRNQYNHIIIDCAPDLDELTINALTASDGFLIPVTPEFLPYVAMETLNNIVSEIRENLNPNLKLIGAIMNNVEHNRKIGEQIINRVNQLYGDRFFKAKINRYVAINEAQAARKSIFEYDQNSKAAKQFDDFANEFINKLK